MVDRRHHNNALIVADLSYDPTYAETLVETFGPRVIGLQISRHGDGMHPEWRRSDMVTLPVYTIGRTFLIELFHAELQSDLVRLTPDPMVRQAYEQLANLELELKEGGAVYTCPPGKHDDLGISVAMLTWAARHPHVPSLVPESANAAASAEARHQQLGSGVDLDTLQVQVRGHA